MKKLHALLMIARTPGLGPIRIRQCLNHTPNPMEWFHKSAQTLAAFGLSFETIQALCHPNWALLEPDLEWLARHSDHHIITLQDSSYPPQLHAIEDAPPVLYIHGQLNALVQPQIAIVGSRNATPAGCHHAHQFAATLAQSGVAVTSGLALGIDGAAHQGALQGNGITIAVTGSGLDQVYPRAHQALAKEIVHTGALVSELPIGSGPLPAHFPRRNRIISGLAQGVFVIEAGKKSGSLITARMALEQGREVFALPGSIHNPLSRGCHHLLREGAKLVESIDDIFAECPELVHGPKKQPCIESDTRIQGLAIEHKKVLDCVDYASTAPDIVIERSGLTVDMVSSYLVDLEIQGYIVSVPGGYMRHGEK